MRIKLWRFIFYVLVLAGLNPAISAADNQFKIKNYDSAAEHQIFATGKLIKLPGTKGINTLPAGSAAYKLADKEFHYRWTPSPAEEKISAAADILDAAITPDESLLILLERLGGSNAANSSRLVFIDLSGGNGVIAAHDLDRRRICQIKVLDNRKLLLLQEAQTALESPGKIILYDMQKRQLKPFQPEFQEMPLNLTVSEEYLWYTVKGEKFVYYLALDEFTAEPKKILTRFEEPYPLFLPGKEKLMVIGPGGWEYFRVNEQDCELLENINADVEAAPRHAGALSVGGDAILWIPGQKILIADHDFGIRNLGKRAGNCFAAARNGEVLYLEQESGGALIKCQMPDAVLEPAVSLQKIKPQTKGRSFKYFALSGKVPGLLVVDQMAGVYQINFAKRKPQKNLIYTPEK